MDRNDRWKRASLVLLPIEPFLAGTLKQLGKIDATLYEKDTRFRQIRTRNDIDPQEWADLEDSIVLAYLWVLGTYEVIRTLDQLFRERGVHANGKGQGSTQVKYSFERVRIPLAKLKPANRHKNTDERFAYPTLDSLHGIGWQVSPGVVISRGELSTELLDFLENLPPDITGP